jgi:hypothetical protein
MVRTITLIFLFFLLLQIHAQQKDSSMLYRGEDGFVSFASDAPLEFIRAESNALKGLVDPESGTFAFQLATQTLTGFNSPLQQEHFYENYIESEKYPTASFSGRIIETVDYEKPGRYEIRAKGILDIHGVKQERIIKVDLEVGKEQFKANSTFMINLEDHNISIPKLVTQKIAEEVEVNIAVTLKKEPTHRK